MMASLPLRGSAAEASAWSQANEDNEVVGHHRGPNIGLEVIEPAPGAAGQAVGPLKAGDAGLDPGPEVAQPAIDPAAADLSGPTLLCMRASGRSWPRRGPVSYIQTPSARPSCPSRQSVRGGGRAGWGPSRRSRWARRSRAAAR